MRGASTSVVAARREADEDPLRPHSGLLARAIDCAVEAAVERRLAKMAAPAEYLTTADAAHIVGKTTRSLETVSKRGDGSPFARPAVKTIRYERKAAPVDAQGGRVTLAEWLASGCAATALTDNAPAFRIAVLARARIIDGACKGPNPRVIGPR